jgi:hypothetical protein
LFILIMFGEQYKVLLGWYPLLNSFIPLYRSLMKTCHALQNTAVYGWHTV